MSICFNLKLNRKNFSVDLKAQINNKTTGIFGPSGAGKTTLFNLISGLIKPDSGFITINGRPVTDIERHIFIPPYKRKIGVVFQEKLLFPHLNIKENILFSKKYNREDNLNINELIELFELEKISYSYPSQVSGGEQQRTAIARALYTMPEILLLDEPFNAVDSDLRTSMLPYLKRIRDVLKIQMLLISHDLPDIQRMTDEVYLIEDGRCKGFGNIIDVLSQDKGIASKEDLINTIDIDSSEKICEGLYSCRIKEIHNYDIKSAVSPGGKFTLTIQPDEIALSKKYNHDISIQNQIPGKITNIYSTDNANICIIDAGIQLITKLTRESFKRLNLQTDDYIYCLFKAHSLHL